MIDPDDDPRVVYYRTYGYQDTRVMKYVRDHMDLSNRTVQDVVNGLKNIQDAPGMDLTPPYINYLQGIVAENPRDDLEKAVLDWQINYQVKGPVADNPEYVYVDTLGPWRRLHALLREHPDNSTSSSTLSNKDDLSSTRTSISSSSSFSSSSALSRRLDSIAFQKLSGYYTRRPLPRSTGPDSILKVDLEQFRSQMSAIEEELNAMLSYFRYALSFSEEFDLGPTERRRSELNRRFNLLATQFMPNYIQELVERDKAFEKL